MKYYDEVGPASNAARKFAIANEDDLPAHVVEKVMPHTETGASPVTLLVAFVEAIYANRPAIADVSPVGLEIAAGCADLIHQKGYHAGLDGRAIQMVEPLRRDSSEEAPAGHPWPDPETDVAANPDYQPPAEPAAAPEGQD